jgi:ribulose-5-phosphate 4-epimerase/fuculose-1-phosphate aldolase
VTVARTDGGPLDTEPLSGELPGRVATACRVLGQLGATHSTFGHVSCRDGDDRMLIRGKGPDETGLRFTEPGDVVGVSFEVAKLDGRAGLRPPSESFLHAWLYRLRPDAGAVIHMHPESVVLLTICGRGLQPVYGAYGRGAQLAVEGVPVYDSSLTISNHQRGKAFAEFMGDSRAALLRGHGVAVVGRTIEEAAVTTMELKELADVTYRALQIGEPAELSADEQAEIAVLHSGDRPLGSAGGAKGTEAMWRYYLSAAGEQD